MTATVRKVELPYDEETNIIMYAVQVEVAHWRPNEKVRYDFAVFQDERVANAVCEGINKYKIYPPING